MPLAEGIGWSMVSANNFQGSAFDLVRIALARHLPLGSSALKSLGIHFASIPLRWTTEPLRWAIELFHGQFSEERDSRVFGAVFDDFQLWETSVFH